MKKMMSFKGTIFAEVNHEKNTLQFYWTYKDKQTWLFDQRYTKKVYMKFKSGLRDYDIRKYKWGYDSRMDKTMYKIPYYMAYISGYVT